MTKQEPINTEALTNQAQNSKEKEAYIQLEKTKTYRIGAGARANPPSTSTLFVEVIINLSAENNEVDVRRLENALILLKQLKARGYKSTYEDGNHILCESTNNVQNPNSEYQTIRTLIQKAHF